VIKSLAAQLPGETAALDAQVLLAHVTGQSRAWLLSHPELSLTPNQEKALKTAIKELQAGLPLPYVLGHWEFFGLDFNITPEVLIPRPETELLIETALAEIRSRPKLYPRFLDIGTGSGIIPVTLATYVPHAELVATDISSAALDVARANAEKHGVSERIRFIEADLIPDDGRWAMAGETSVNSLLSTVDLLTANLPYIPSETLKTLEIFGKEPTLALDGGDDGLDLIRRLLARLTANMAPGSSILLEIEERQGLAVRVLAREAFPAADIQVKKDLGGHDRLAIINT
jgi:release factor glutamine methyltransferase